MPFSEPSHATPLADRLRPKNLNEFIGQSHIVHTGGWFENLLKMDRLPSLIFWGPPGVGKTTLAKIIAVSTQHRFVTLSAVNSGVKEVREVIEAAEKLKRGLGQGTILFIDEIHRFNKAQQDAFLPSVEDGTITLIGATTENPSFEVNSALLSRCQVLVLKALSEEDLKKILQQACTKISRPDFFNEDASEFLITKCYGDARYLLNILEDLCLTFPDQSHLGKSDIEKKINARAALYDKKSEHHYNVISAFIKSMRGSDPDAALYYLARMLDAGEDLLFIARRLVIFASEDVGNANPQAVQIAISCLQSVDFIGRAEGWIPLAQCTTYLACSPKSNASYKAYKKALEDVQKYGPLEVPLHLRNAPTDLMKNLGYGKNYEYAHDNAEGMGPQHHLPESLQNKRYYFPSGHGHEIKLSEWLEKALKKRNGETL